MSRNDFAYHVSPEQRRREVQMETEAIAQYDARLKCPELAPEWGPSTEPYCVVAHDLAWAQALGCEGATLRALIDYIEADKSPLYDGLPEYGPGWYKAGEAECRRIEKVVGDRVYPLARTKELRAHAVRKLRTARKALEAA